jgi:hypothetical protein
MIDGQHRCQQFFGGEGKRVIGFDRALGMLHLATVVTVSIVINHGFRQTSCIKGEGDK